MSDTPSATTYFQLQGDSQDIAVLDNGATQVGAAHGPSLREQVARALVYKSMLLEKLGRSEQALMTYDDLIARFGETPEPELRQQVATALVDKAVLLDKLGRHDQALAIFDDVVARFGTAEKPTVGFAKKELPFGSIKRVVPELSPSVTQRNIEEGQQALSRGAEAFLSRGVELRPKQGVAYYHADPTDPELLVQTLDGKERRGKLIDGRFEPANST